MEKQIDDGAHATAALNHPEAIRILEDALRKIRSNPALKNWRRSAWFGSGMRISAAAARRRAEVLRTHARRRGKLQTEDGRRACAEAQYGLGTVQMYQGDFPAAARNLEKR